MPAFEIEPPLAIFNTLVDHQQMQDNPNPLIGIMSHSKSKPNFHARTKGRVLAQISPGQQPSFLSRYGHHKSTLLTKHPQGTVYTWEIHSLHRRFVAHKPAAVF
jgi:hypothetical protein